MTEFHNRLSRQSVYRRFLYPHGDLSADEVERFTHVDYMDRMALIVEDGPRLVAVGRYERLAETTEAEVAFVVADRYQHQGIATSLLERLVEAARDRGIDVFVARTLSDNRDMLDVFMRSGFPVSTAREGGTVTVRFPIRPEDRRRLSPLEGDGADSG